MGCNKNAFMKKETEEKRNKILNESVESYQKQNYAPGIIGAKVMGLRKATRSEALDLGFTEERPDLIVLDNGTRICASMDSEGNAPGVFFTLECNGSSSILIPKK